MFWFFMFTLAYEASYAENLPSVSPSRPNLSTTTAHLKPTTESRKLNNFTTPFSKITVSATPVLEVPLTTPQKLFDSADLFLNKEYSTPPSELGSVEDQKVINETFAKYGSFQDYTKLELPGTEILNDDNVFDLKNSFTTDGSGMYTLRVRTITEYFSYNGRYEETKIKKIEKEEFTVTKGQFGEHFERKNGGFYIRTIGYTLDENGYQQFVIDLTTAKNITNEVFVVDAAPGSPGTAKNTTNFLPPLVVGAAPGSPGNKISISSTVLQTLIGGNALG